MFNPTTEADVDSSRLRNGELVAGIGGIALFLFLFFDWFGNVGGFSGASLDGWSGLGGDFTGFLVALTSVVGVALAVLAAAGQRLNVPLPRGALTAGLGSMTVLIILWRFFANPGDLKIGIFLGLAAAVAIAAGALMALSEDGFRPLVAVASARTTAVAASSAPAATPKPPPKASGSTKRTTVKKGSAKKVSAKQASAKSPAKKKSTKKNSAKKTTGKKSGSRTTGAKRSSGSRKK
jgi:hypothetical protein